MINLETKLVDVHTHLTHEKFSSSIDELLPRLEESMHAVICNGLEPVSNRTILRWAGQYNHFKAALGIYPLNAVNDCIKNDFPLKVEKFDVNDEIKFIESKAEAGEIIAIGECGLDGYWLDESTYKAQENVFESLIDIALRHDLPVIIHTRKLEKRSIEILNHCNIERVNFHCFGGKTKLALKASENHDWCFSIPAISRKNQGFAKLLKELPEDKILTETDAPYLAPISGDLNNPLNVKLTTEHLAELRGWSKEYAINRVYENYKRLFKQ